MNKYGEGKKEFMGENMLKKILLCLSLILIAFLFYFIIISNIFVTSIFITVLSVFLAIFFEYAIGLEVLWRIILSLIKTTTWLIGQRKAEKFKGDINSFAKTINESFSGVLGYLIGKIVYSPFVKETEEGAYIEQGYVTVKVKWDGNDRRVFLKILIYYLRVSLLSSSRGRIPRSFILCIVYAIVEDFFITMPDTLDYFHEKFLEPFLKENIRRKKIIDMLRVLRERKILFLFLFRLRDAKNKVQARHLLEYFYYDIANKERGKNITRKNVERQFKFVFIMLGRRKVKFNLLRYIKFIRLQIENKKIRWIYLVATDRKTCPINVVLAQALDKLLQREVRVKKLMSETFERRDTSIPMETFVAAYEII